MVSEPVLEDASLVCRLEPSQGATGQRGCSLPLPCCRCESGEGQSDQLLRLVILLGQPFRQSSDAGRGARVEGLQHGQHLGSHPVAAEAGIRIGGVQPDGKFHLAADSSRVLPGKRQQRAHKLHTLGQRARCPQCRQAPLVTAPRKIQQKGFRPVGRGVCREHMGTSKRCGLFSQAVVTPLARRRFGGRSRFGPLAAEGETLGLRPGSKGLGLGGGFAAPGMVTVPEGELPGVERLQIPQQPGQGHGVLASRDGHQQVGAPWQQGRLVQEVPVKLVVVRSPSPGRRRSIGWENHGLYLACLQMSRHSSLPAPLQEAIGQRRLLKVIAGLTNRDQASVERIARAAAAGGADLLDLACDPSLVERILEVAPGLPLCVSAVDPALFPAAVAAGAAMVEIGNFDAFYAKGLRFEAEEVLGLTLRTRELLPDVVLSVTVPHVLPLDQQEQLAVALAHAGADWIQTEGGTSAHPVSAGVLGLIEKSAPTLAATHAISRALAAAEKPLPVLCASGLSAVTVPLALAAGASGVGVGSAVNRLRDEVAMLAVVRALRESVCPSVAPQESPAYRGVIPV